MGAIIVLRIIHIGAGVFWAGGVLFMNFVVGPALGAAGLDGARVMQELHRMHYFRKILGAALLTILAGLDLLRRDSGGFQPAWFRSPFGMGISTGMIAAIIAFLIGLFLISPSLNRLVSIGLEMSQAAPEARAAIAPRLNAARGRMVALGMVATLFVIIAVLAMATARYW
jgi:uncharacterized membrane protein